MIIVIKGAKLMEHQNKLFGSDEIDQTLMDFLAAAFSSLTASSLSTEKINIKKISSKRPIQKIFLFKGIY